MPFVRVGRAWWDSHGQNFETHQEMVPELDHVMATLIDDLEQRGLLKNTLILTLAEFGRTPGINASLGRDHFASAWSVTLTGCGVKGGAVYGKTDPTGNRVDRGRGRRRANSSPPSTPPWASTRTRTTTSARGRSRSSTRAPSRSRTYWRDRDMTPLAPLVPTLCVGTQWDALRPENP